MNKLNNYWPSLSLLKNKHIEICKAYRNMHTIRGIEFHSFLLQSLLIINISEGQYIWTPAVLV